MRLTWQYVRKPKSEEKAWFELLQDKEKAGRFFLNAQQKREDLRKKLTSVKNNKIKEIKTYDTVIKQWHKKLTGLLCNNMPEEFLPFKEDLLEVFPSFWQNLYNKSKTRLNLIHIQSYSKEVPS
jgi:predicted transcriptional regulator YheO